MFVFHRLWMAASMSLDLLKSMLIFSYDSIHMCIHFHQSLVHNFTVSSNVRINLHKYLHITYEHKRTHITKKKSTTKQTVRAIVYAQFFTSLLSQSWFNLFVLFDWIKLHWDFFESFQFKQASCCFMGKKIDTHTIPYICATHKFHSVHFECGIVADSIFLEIEKNIEQLSVLLHYIFTKSQCWQAGIYILKLRE